MPRNIKFPRFNLPGIEIWTRFRRGWRLKRGIEEKAVTINEGYRIGPSGLKTSFVVQSRLIGQFARIGKVFGDRKSVV